VTRDGVALHAGGLPGYPSSHRRPAGPKRRDPIAAVTLEPVVVPTVNRYNPRLGVVYR